MIKKVLIPILLIVQAVLSNGFYPTIDIESSLLAGRGSSILSPKVSFNYELNNFLYVGAGFGFQTQAKGTFKRYGKSVQYFFPVYLKLLYPKKVHRIELAIGADVAYYKIDNYYTTYSVPKESVALYPNILLGYSRFPNSTNGFIWRIGVNFHLDYHSPTSVVAKPYVSIGYLFGAPQKTDHNIH